MFSIGKKIIAVICLITISGTYYIGTGALGNYWGSGNVTNKAAPAAVIKQRQLSQSTASNEIGAASDKQIVFGDLHVHSTFSTDAFVMSMQQTGGRGARPVADACDFARYCSALDFWSINDHALALNPQRWEDTKQSIRDCNSVSQQSSTPDTVAFLGWEWTNIGLTAQTHYGHKNVILRHDEDDKIPARPITTYRPAGTQNPSTLELGALPLLEGFNQDTFDAVRYIQELHPDNFPQCPADVAVRDLPKNCREQAASPEELFAKLDDWGMESMVIPHGTTWGYYTPFTSNWNKQLNARQHDPKRQRLVEVFSGHGNSEQYRRWNEANADSNGKLSCPEPTLSYTPSCWQAGELIYQRCNTEGFGSGECNRRAELARQNYLDAGQSGFLTVPSSDPDDWLDAGQCTDCFRPAFNYRPKSSVQYMMALSNFNEGEDPLRFRFGFMASSDNHSARPGTGYKAYAREVMTEARFGAFNDTFFGGRVDQKPIAESKAFDPSDSNIVFAGLMETDRQSSFFTTGGLVAVHSSGKDKGAIWDGMQRKEVYGTSGPRMLLWFNLTDPATGKDSIPMGSEVEQNTKPVFTVKALGSFEQKSGCPEYSGDALGQERLANLCNNECYNPSNVRRAITRIEVVRIRPQASKGENVDKLIEDPWRVLDCFEQSQGCSVSFSDDEFTSAKRDTLYYVRAIEAPSPVINANPLACDYNEQGQCIKVNICSNPDDDCLAPSEERAWSSPIFVDYRD